MATTGDDDKCLVCAKDCDMVVCELCEAAPYCSDECEAADFISHRQSCKFKEQSLETQKLCAVCDTAFTETDVPPLVCKECFGIKYCSEQCKLENEAEHKDLLCNAYASLPLRPTIEHRLHLFFPAQEAQPRFLWIKSSKPSRHAVIDAEGTAQDIESMRLTRSYRDTDLYDADVYHTAAYLNCKYLLPNRSLGTVTGLPQLRSMKGNALVGLREGSSDADVSPSKLPNLVLHFKEQEKHHERTHNVGRWLPRSAVPY